MAAKVDPVQGCCGPVNTCPLSPEPCLQLTRKSMVSCFKELTLLETGNHSYRRTGMLSSWIRSLSHHTARNSRGTEGQG